MTTKIMIAGCGVGAVRVAKSLVESGYAPVGVYTRDDENSPHRKYLVEDVEVPDYLDVESLVEVAVEMGAEAVHPAYSPLGEDPEFTREVARRGVIFIGSPPSIVELASDKIAVKILAEKAAVPTLPWKEVRRVEDIYEFASVHGYPVVVKAVMGSGGRGCRVVWSESDVERVFEAVRKEAKSVFRDSRLYVEPYLESAKYIEVQVLGDGDNVVHLYEREISAQLKWRKLVKEAPSPTLSQSEREKLADYALAVAGQLRFKGVGSIRFLFDPKKREAYFSEVKVSLKPEHTVTEMTTGVDIVRKQVEIALYGVLDLKQSSVELRGHSIGVSISAENPLTGEALRGVVVKCREPSGLGVRVDLGIAENYRVTDKRELLVAEIAVWAPTRVLAISRLKRALDDFVVEGVVTNAQLLKHLISSEEFTSGAYTLRFLEEKESYFRELVRESLELQSATLVALLELGVNSVKKLYEKGAERVVSEVRRISGLKRSAWYYYTLLKHEISTRVRKSRGSHLKPK
jgi:pyruvate carboxylase subunit A